MALKAGATEMPINRKYERDIDLFLAEEFSSSAAFSKWFLDQTPLAGRDAKVEDVFVGSADSNGESDLVVFFRSAVDEIKFALLIEDKIDAPFQPDQEARYRLRGTSLVESGKIESFSVVLCAPQAYQTSSSVARSFEAFVSYEAIGEFLDGSDNDARTKYRAQFIKTAASKSANLWTRIDDKTTNEFWRAGYTLAAKEYPLLEMKPLKVTKGATWINFRPHDMPTMPQRFYVSFKGDRGQIDLTFTGSAAHRFHSQTVSILDQDMTVHQTGKSAAIRLQVDGFRTDESWQVAEPKLRAAFAASERLIKFYRANREALDSAAAASKFDASTIVQ
jgi:hypothetical protein